MYGSTIETVITLFSCSVAISQKRCPPLAAMGLLTYEQKQGQKKGLDQLFLSLGALESISLGCKYGIFWVVVGISLEVQVVLSRTLTAVPPSEEQHPHVNKFRPVQACNCSVLQE